MRCSHVICAMGLLLGTAACARSPETDTVFAQATVQHHSERGGRDELRLLSLDYTGRCYRVHRRFWVATLPDDRTFGIPSGASLNGMVKVPMLGLGASFVGFDRVKIELGVSVDLNERGPDVVTIEPFRLAHFRTLRPCTDRDSR